MSTIIHPFRTLLSSQKRNTILASVSFSLFVCLGIGCNNDNDLDIAQLETQQIVDSFDEIVALPLEIGPAIALANGLFAEDIPPNEVEFTLALGGLLESINPCLKTVSVENVMAITWDLFEGCEAGIVKGLAVVSVTIEGDTVILDVTDEFALTVNLTSFLSTMTLEIDPANKSALLTRTVEAERGEDVFVIEQEGDIVLNNDAIPNLTFNVERTVTLNEEITREQTVTDLVFQIFLRTPLSGSILIEEVGEDSLELVFLTEEDVATVDATLTKADNSEQTFNFLINADKDDLIELEN